MASTLHSDVTTEGIRIQVHPRYLPDYSHPDKGQWVFAYRVVLSNVGDPWAKLTARHWIIINADGKRSEVRGPGVVGLQPELPPGATHEYESFCPIDSPWGTMEGSYQMAREDRTPFDAIIGRFYLGITADTETETGNASEEINDDGSTTASLRVKR